MLQPYYKEWKHLVFLHALIYLIGCSLTIRNGNPFPLGIFFTGRISLQPYYKEWKISFSTHFINPNPQLQPYYKEWKRFKICCNCGFLICCSLTIRNGNFLCIYVCMSFWTRCSLTIRNGNNFCFYFVSLQNCVAALLWGFVTGFTL